MFNGEGGREASGEIPQTVFEYLKEKGYTFSVQRGTEEVTLVIKGCPCQKVWPTRKKIMQMLEAAKAPSNIGYLFL